MHLTDQSSQEDISNPPTTSTQMVDVEEEAVDVMEEAVEDVVFQSVLNNHQIGSNIDQLQRMNEALKAEYPLLKNQLESLVSKVEHLEDHNQFLEEHLSLAGQVRGLFKPFAPVLQHKWLRQQGKVLREMRDTRMEITRLLDLQKANLEKREKILRIELQDEE